MTPWPAHMRIGPQVFDHEAADDGVSCPPAARRPTSTALDVGPLEVHEERSCDLIAAKGIRRASVATCLRTQPN